MTTDIAVIPTPRTSRRRWLAAAVIGVVVSIATALVLPAADIYHPSSTLLGVLVGGTAAWALSNSPGVRGWFLGLLAVFVAQLALGIAIGLLIYATL